MDEDRLIKIVSMSVAIAFVAVAIVVTAVCGFGIWALAKYIFLS